MTGWLIQGVLLAILAAVPPGPAAPVDVPTLYCDGIPPELVNKDDQEHSYVLECGRKTEQHTIAAGTSQSLEGKSGCKLILGENKPTALYTEMVCNIEGGKLTCDLL